MAEESYEHRLARELDNIEERAEFAFQGHIEQAKRWGRGHTYVGLPAAVVSAAGATASFALAEQRDWLGVITVVAAGLTAAFLFLDPQGRGSQHAHAAELFRQVATGARQARLVDLGAEADDRVRSRLANLTDKFDVAASACGPYGKKAYEQAKKNIESGGQEARPVGDGA
jgi:hypothetical protein